MIVGFEAAGSARGRRPRVGPGAAPDATGAGVTKPRSAQSARATTGSLVTSCSVIRCRFGEARVGARLGGWPVWRERQFDDVLDDNLQLLEEDVGAHRQHPGLDSDRAIGREHHDPSVRV